MIAIGGARQQGGVLTDHLDIADDKISEARLLVTEAIINGLEHGGEDNPRVDVVFTMTTEELIVDVRDFGKGFTPSMVEDPDIEKKLGTKHKRGWGLKVMKSMSDDFRIESNNGGTKITMKKLLK